jgi:hypothetical protein
VSAGHTRTRSISAFSERPARSRARPFYSRTKPPPRQCLGSSSRALTMLD